MPREGYQDYIKPTYMNAEMPYEAAKQSSL